MASRKSSEKENYDVVRKSILMNPEIPLNNEQTRNKNKRVTINNCPNNFDDLFKEPASSKSLHEPRINKLAEWRQTIEEIKDYSAKEIKDMADVSKNTQDFINRAVS